MTAQAAGAGDRTLIAAAPDRWIRLAALPLTLALTLLLFVSWPVSGLATDADSRSELVVATVALVAFGAVALAFPSRWTALLAAVPSLVHLTDLGPVLWPTAGHQSGAVRAVVVIGSVVGVLWIAGAAVQTRLTATSPPWLFVPVGIVLSLASLGLPWAIVSNAGLKSGTTTAWDLIMGPPAGLPAGVAPVRITILLSLFVAVAAATAPIFVHSRRLVLTASVCVFSAMAVLVGLQVFMAARVDAIEPATQSPGLRVALAGLLVLGIVWTAPRDNGVPEVAGLPLAVRPDLPHDLAA